MTTDDDSASLSGLEKRVAALEDVVEIYRLVAAYGPAVDSDSRLAASQLWLENGVYDVDLGVWTGHAEIEGMLASDLHQHFLAPGCSHQVSLPYVIVDGNRAVVTNYMQLLINDGDGFEILRQTAHRWELVRVDQGWRIATRTSRLLDGSEPARQILRSAFRLEAE